jgi:hypothetical protein
LRMFLQKKAAARPAATKPAENKTTDIGPEEAKAHPRPGIDRCRR